MFPDIRLALRGLWRAPTLTVVAVLSLALGIGATSSVFTVVSALLLKPLPYQDADRLVILWNRSPGIGIAEDWFSTAQYFDIKQGHRGFEEVAIAIGANWNLTGTGEPERVGVLRVSSNLLPMLGVRAALGQLLTTDDDRPGRTGRALLGHGTWMRRFGGNPSVVGQPLTLNDQTYEIAGVLPASFDIPREVMPTLGGAEHAEIIVSLPLASDAAAIRNREDYNILGKLARGVALASAQAEMDAITAQLRREHPGIYPANGGLTFDIVPLQQQVVGDVQRSLLILAASVGFVLLIACANVANLLLSRAIARRAEVTMHIALGAERRRLVRRFLTESLILALLGASGGLLLTGVMLQGIRILGAASVPRLGEVALNRDVLFFTLAVSLVSTIVFGLIPALRSSRDTAINVRANTGRVAGGGSIWSRMRAGQRQLVAAEVALAVVVLIGAGLLIRSFQQLVAITPGFNPSNVLTFELTLTGRKYTDPERVIDTYRQLWQRLRALPGVEGAGGVSMLPLSDMFAWGPVVLEGRGLPSGESFVNVDQRSAGGDYFAVMQIPLLQGRLFTEHDTREMPRVVIVDDHMAQVLWPGEDPIGKRLRRGGMDADANAPWLTVVGVVGRVKQYALDERDSRIAMYHPHTQTAARAMNVTIRGATPDVLVASATATVRAIDPDLPIYNVKTMARRVDDSLAARQLAMFLLTTFALVALVLASVGIYGVLASAVAQGQRDIGIRLAIGATPQRIVAMVVGEGVLVTVVGMALGLVSAVLLGTLLDEMLFGVDARDPVTFTAVALLLIGVALSGSYVPARRAASIDPAASLRGNDGRIK